MMSELAPNAEPRVLELRGQLVMLSSDAATAFGVETRQVVQNIKNNSVKLPPRYAFEVTEEERELLRSSGMISKAGRGGSRARPWALTQKGIVRLATIMECPRALEATDLIIDVFTEVLMQVVQGKEAVHVAAASRLAPSEEEAAARANVRMQVVKAIESLLNTRIDPDAGTTIREEMGEVASAAMSHIKELMRARKVSNERIEAEALLIVEQTRDVFERRQADFAGATLDRERKALENFEKKIALVLQLLGMMDKLAPNAVVGLLPRFARSLPDPDKD